jgi:preprotein translocase subunit SecF
MRFQLRFSVGAIAALVHDVLITLGLFSITQFDFDLTVLAALLAVIGYSLNDTIVVFDRVRENFRKLRESTPVEVFNVSLNQTLSRTIITSLTTLFVLMALFFFGGEIIHSFSIALIVGVLIGTYSSLFVASPVTIALGITKEDLMPVQKEGAELDNMP